MMIVQYKDFYLKCCKKEESKIQDIEAKIISENEKKKDDNNTNKEDCE